MSYADDVMRPEEPLFYPFAKRRDDRLFLVVSSRSGPGVRTIELTAVMAAKLAVDLHECLTAIARQHRAEAACPQKADPVSTAPSLPKVWSTQNT